MEKKSDRSEEREILDSMDFILKEFNKSPDSALEKARLLTKNFHPEFFSILFERAIELGFVDLAVRLKNTELKV